MNRYNSTGSGYPVSADTVQKAQKIAGVLSVIPMTAAEINAALWEDYTALQIANAIKFISGVATTKVIRTTTDGKGLRMDKEYTAYYLDGSGTGKVQEPKKSKKPGGIVNTKGASADTAQKAKAIAGVLSVTPLTAAEINAALGTDYTFLQIANAVKFISGVATTKVVRAATDGKGLRTDKEYTAYYLDGSGPDWFQEPQKPAKSTASADMMLRAKRITYVLTSTPMTAVEINSALGECYSAQQIANAVKLISRVTTTKVTRTTINEEGRRVPKEYTAYSRSSLWSNSVQTSWKPGTSAGIRGATADEEARAKEITQILSATPMTTAEINAVLGTDYTALQVANAAKLIPGVIMTKVLRTTVNAKGLRADKEYTAYSIS